LSSSRSCASRGPATPGYPMSASGRKRTSRPTGRTGTCRPLFNPKRPSVAALCPPAPPWGRSRRVYPSPRPYHCLPASFSRLASRDWTVSAGTSRVEKAAQRVHRVWVLTRTCSPSSRSAASAVRLMAWRTSLGSARGSCARRVPGGAGTGGGGRHSGHGARPAGSPEREIRRGAGA
jgi:hypothetical protein